MRHPKPTHEQNIGRAVRKAAKVLEDRGWTQGTDIARETRQMCTRGAINFAILGESKMFSGIHPVFRRNKQLHKKNELVELAWDSVTAFSNWLRQNGYGSDTVSWNDTKGRTKEEVIAYLNKFADEKDIKCL
jgi:hypothetical protein